MPKPIPSSRRRAAAVALVAALAIVSIALALQRHGSAQAAPYAGWAWSGPPGVPAQGSPVAAASARDAGVDASSIRVLASAASSGREYRVLASLDPVRKQVCLAFDAGLFASPFRCLGDIGGDAVVHYFAGGGASTGAIDHVVLLGTARRDVTGLVLTLQDGSQKRLALNRWRAFAYTGQSAGDMPTSLTAVGSAGQTLQEIPLGGAAPPAQG